MTIADDIALYALGYWSHESHPLRLDHLCLNTIQRKYPCTDCSDACPQGVNMHKRGKINWSACTNCNLCVTACPTAAINQSQASFDNVRRRVLDGTRAVSFGCERAKEACDVRCSCLAALPWDLLAAAALSHGVVIMAKYCQECPHANLVEQVKRLVSDLKRFLGKEAFAQLVHMNPNPDARNDGQSKRMAMASVAATAHSGASNLLEGSDKPTMSCYRALLVDVLMQREQAGNPATVNWPTLVEDGVCRGCEICSKMCPHKALTVHVPGFEKGDVNIDMQTVEAQGFDTGTQMLLHQVNKCTQCGLCYMNCPTEGLGGWQRVARNTVPAIVDLPISVVLCEKCQRPFKPQEDETRCPACSRFKFK